MFVAEPSGGEAGVLGGAEDGDGRAVQGGEGKLAIIWGEEPETARAALATDIGGKAAEKIEVTVAGEEAGVEGETGFLAIAEAAIDVWEGAFDEVLEIDPIGGVVGFGIGGEDHVPGGADEVCLGAKTLEEEDIEIAGIEVEAFGEFGASGFELGGFDGEDEVAAFFGGKEQAIFEMIGFEDCGIGESGWVNWVAGEMA